MAAITWRNVDAPSIGEASRAMYLGQHSINQGFDKLGDILKQEETRNNANWDQGKINNSNAYLDELSTARTPEKLQAKQALLAQMRQGYGAQVDSGAIRAATDGRERILQDRLVSRIDYDNKVIDNKEAPLRDAAASLIAQGKTQEAAPIIDQLSRNRASLYQAIDTNNEQATQRGQRNIQFSNQQQLFPGQLAEQKSVQALRAAQIDKYAAEAEKDRADAATELSGGGKFAKRQEAAYEEVRKNGSFNSGTLDSKEGREIFTKWVNENIKNNSEKSDIIYNFGKLANAGHMVEVDGKKVRMPLPVSAAISAIEASTDPISLLPGWSMRGDGAVGIYTSHLQDNYKSITDDYAALQQFANAKISAGLPKPSSEVTPSVVKANVDKLKATAPKPYDEWDIGGPPNKVNVNDQAWMEAQRKRAKEKNAKLSPEIKARLNMRE